MRNCTLFIFSLFLVGCSYKGYWGPVLEVSPPDCVMGRYDVTVSSGRVLDDPSMEGTEIEIDVIALTNEQYCEQGWFKRNLLTYFNPEGDDLRDNAPVWKAKFQTGDGPKTLSANDPLWALWEAENATHLVIIAQRVDGNETDNDDARRIVLPLDRSRWLDDSIELRLMSSGLVLRTNRLPPWPGQPKEKLRHY